MIKDALYTTLSAIVDTYPINGDVDAKLPIAIFGERHNPQRTKDGVYGYEGSGVVSVVSRTIEECRNLTEQLATAMAAMVGNEIQGTTFRQLQTGEVNTDFDPDDNAYYSELQFTFKTKNL